MANILDTTQVAVLVIAAKTGNADAFGSLYDGYVRKIYDFIYYKTLNQELAEDITSTVFIKAWQHINQFREGSFAAWLYTIARNAVSDHYRRERDHLDIDDCWDLADQSDFLANIDQGLKLEKVRSSLSGLKPEEREILMMRFWLELSFQEIAEHLGKKEGAVKMSCGRALKSLKDKMPLAIFILLPGIINICKKMS